MAPRPAQASRVPCVTDDTAVEVCLERSPTRIISLYGAFTEILWELGIGARLVARTSNDDTLAELQNLPAVGTGLRPNVEYLLALRPDLVVARGGRAGADTVAVLRARGIPTVAFAPGGLADVYATVLRLGTLVAREAEARSLVEGIRAGLETVRQRVASVGDRPSVVFEVRAEPLTVAGTGSLVNELVLLAGGQNAVRSPKKLLMLDTEALLRLDPDAYVVQEGPMNRNPRPPDIRVHFRELRAVRERRVLNVDEKLFSRPGPRVSEAAERLSRFLHPERWGLVTQE